LTRSGPAADIPLAARFANPPAEGRILKIIHGWPDAPEARKALVDKLTRQGYGGVVCNVAFGGGYVESEPKWAAFLDGVKAARAAGWSLWLYDERGYPSGMAGGIVLRDHPEFEARGLLVADTTTEGKAVDLAAPPGKVLSVAAFPVRARRIEPTGKVDLSDRVKNGRLRWDPPAGSWRVLLVTESRLFEGTHAASNVFEHVPYVNLLQPETTAYFLKVTHDRYAAKLGADLGATFVSTFTDEPSLMSLFMKPMPYKVLPWAANLPAEFRKRRGYDLPPIIADLVADAGPAGRKHRYDFWLTIGELVSANYFGQIQTWCHAHHLRSGGHLLLEESLVGDVPLYGDFFRCARRLDAQSVDCLTSIPAEVPWQIGRLLASAGALEGKTLVMSETSDHSQRYRPPGDRRPVRVVTESEIRGTFNRQMVGGVNRITSYYSFGGLSDEAVQRLNLWVGRCATTLTGGDQVADVAVVYPVESVWTRFVPSREWTREATEAQRVESLYNAALDGLYNARRDMTIVDSRALTESIVEAGALVHGRLRWRVVVLPGVDTLPLAAWENLARFVRQGGVVIALGSLPANSETEFPAPRVQALAAELFGADLKESRTRAFPSGGATLFLPGGSEALLPLALQGIVVPDVKTADPHAPVRVTHRRIDGHEVFFLINDSGKAWAGDVRIAASGPCDRLDPATGRIQPCDASAPIHLDLEPYGAVLLRFAAAVVPRRLPIASGTLPNLRVQSLPRSEPVVRHGEFVHAELRPDPTASTPSHPAWDARAVVTKGKVDVHLFADFPYQPPADLSMSETLVVDTWVPDGQATANSLLVILLENDGAEYLAATGRSLAQAGHERSVIPISRFRPAGWSTDKNGTLDLKRVKALRIGWGGYIGAEGETVRFSIAPPQAGSTVASPGD
jgi:hypothetical protein